MTSSHPSRRILLATVATTAALPTAALAGKVVGRPPAEPFRYCLNTATIRGQKLPLEQEVEVAAKAGYQGFEPWIEKLELYAKAGKSLKDLGKRIADLGMTVESAIGFPAWIVDDETQRRKGLEQARREMDLLAQLGGKRLAAPPVGAQGPKDAKVDLLQAAERYRALLDVGDAIGVVPQIEVWGFSRNVSRLGEAVLIAVESRHPKACVLADVYHLHKGGSGFGGFPMLGQAALGVFHVNDYPATPGPDKITDAQRVYPGDGVAPLAPLLRSLYGIGFRGTLSLELFNPDYYKRDPLEVAKTGLIKMKQVVQAAFAGQHP